MSSPNLNKFTRCGGNGLRVPPVPIPNTEVKPQHADGTWLETARESRSLTHSNSGFAYCRSGFFIYSLMQYEAAVKTMRRHLRALNRRRAPCRLLCSFRLERCLLSNLRFDSKHFAFGETAYLLRRYAALVLRVALGCAEVPTGHTLSSGVLGSRRPGRVGRCRIPIPR